MADYDPATLCNYLAAHRADLPEPQYDTSPQQHQRAQAAAAAMTGEPSVEYLGRYFGKTALPMESDRLVRANPELWRALRVFAVRRGLAN